MTLKEFIDELPQNTQDAFVSYIHNGSVNMLDLKDTYKNFKQQYVGEFENHRIAGRYIFELITNKNTKLKDISKYMYSPELFKLSSMYDMTINEAEKVDFRILYRLIDYEKVLNILSMEDSTICFFDFKYLFFIP